MKSYALNSIICTVNFSIYWGILKPGFAPPIERVNGLHQNPINVRKIGIFTVRRRNAGTFGFDLCHWSRFCKDKRIGRREGARAVKPGPEPRAAAGREHGEDPPLAAFRLEVISCERKQRGRGQEGGTCAFPERTRSPSPRLGTAADDRAVVEITVGLAAASRRTGQPLDGSSLWCKPDRNSFRRVSLL